MCRRKRGQWWEIFASQRGHLGVGRKFLPTQKESVKYFWSTQKYGLNYRQVLLSSLPSPSWKPRVEQSELCSLAVNPGFAITGVLISQGLSLILAVDMKIGPITWVAHQHHLELNSWPRTMNAGRFSQPLGLCKCFLWLWARFSHPTLLLC